MAKKRWNVGMKYQTRMVIYYTTIAFIMSLMLGLTVFWSGLHEQNRDLQERLAITARQVAVQVENRLQNMDAVINYILSSPDTLSDITFLGTVSPENAASSYVYEASTEIENALTTDFILRNTYRTVFFNQNGFLFSSYIRNSSNPAGRRTAEGFSPESLPYLESAEAARGKSILVGSHPDPFSQEQGIEVYSVVKALQGYRMGYVEVQNTLSSLDTLKRSDREAGFRIYINDGELLYASRGPEGDSDFQLALRELHTDEAGTFGDDLIAKAASEEYPITVLAFQPALSIHANLAIPLVTSIVASFAVFAFGLFLVVFWSFLLTKPINQLRAVIESTNLDNLVETQRLGLKSNVDEIQALEHSYQAMISRLNEAIQNEKQASMLQLQAQFDVLQTQVNPHFIYNVLNIISAHGVMADDDGICEICSSLAAMLRYSTSNKERYAMVRQEVSYLESYFYLLKARYEDRFTYQIELSEAVKAETIPKTVLQQIAENSMKHGFGNGCGDMRLSVRGEQLPDRWEISIRDNGCGVSEENLRLLREKMRQAKADILEHHKLLELEIGGMGLVNLYARCLLLYGSRMIFEIRNLNPGTEVVLGSYVPRKEE